MEAAGSFETAVIHQTKGVTFQKTANCWLNCLFLLIWETNQGSQIVLFLTFWYVVYLGAANCDISKSHPCSAGVAALFSIYQVSQWSGKYHNVWSPRKPISTLLVFTCQKLYRWIRKSSPVGEKYLCGVFTLVSSWPNNVIHVNASALTSSDSVTTVLILISLCSDRRELFVRKNHKECANDKEISGIKDILFSRWNHSCSALNLW
jgi:hypothetical protein